MLKLVFYLVNRFVFLRHPLLIFKKNVFFFSFSLITQCALFLAWFHTLLYFEHRVFLALNNVFSYYNKDTQRNQNTVIHGTNIFFCLFRSSVLQANYMILVDKVVSTVTKPNHSPWQNTKACRSHCRRDIQRFLLSLRRLFFCRLTFWKILNLPWYFIANVLSTWISKADRMYDCECMTPKEMNIISVSLIICLTIDNLICIFT